MHSATHQTFTIALQGKCNYYFYPTTEQNEEQTDQLTSFPESQFQTMVDWFRSPLKHNTIQLSLLSRWEWTIMREKTGPARTRLCQVCGSKTNQASQKSKFKVDEACGKVSMGRGSSFSCDGSSKRWMQTNKQTDTGHYLTLRQLLSSLLMQCRYMRSF